MIKLASIASNEIGPNQGGAGSPTPTNARSSPPPTRVANPEKSATLPSVAGRHGAAVGSASVLAIVTLRPRKKSILHFPIDAANRECAVGADLSCRVERQRFSELGFVVMLDGHGRDDVGVPEGTGMFGLPTTSPFEAGTSIPLASPPQSVMPIEPAHGLGRRSDLARGATVRGLGFPPKNGHPNYATASMLSAS